MLFLATLVAFLPTLNNGFVDCDDNQYITENPAVLKGLSWQGVGWAFTAVHGSNWHPLTWISHMTDVQFFGVRPRGHHLVSLLIHAAASALLLLTLAAMTGEVWPSAFAVSWFSLHPLRVESVAWAAERKDVTASSMTFLEKAPSGSCRRRPRNTPSKD